MVEGEMQGLAACASHEGDEMMAGAGCRCLPPEQLEGHEELCVAESCVVPVASFLAESCECGLEL